MSETDAPPSPELFGTHPTPLPGGDFSGFWKSGSHPPTYFLAAIGTRPMSQATTTDAIEEAYHATDGAAASLAQVGEDVPRLNIEAEWTDAQIRRLDRRLDELRQSIQAIDGDVSRALFALDRVREAEEAIGDE